MFILNLNIHYLFFLLFYIIHFIKSSEYLIIIDSLRNYFKYKFLDFKLSVITLNFSNFFFNYFIKNLIRFYKFQINFLNRHLHDVFIILIFNLKTPRWSQDE